MATSKGMSSTQRTIRALKNQGCICDVAEKFNAHVGPFGIRQDLFGFIDVISLAPDCILAIQCCTGSGYQDHLRKILANEFAPQWLMSGGRIELWAWRKILAKRGGKQKIWQPKVREIVAADFQITDTDTPFDCDLPDDLFELPEDDDGED